MRGICCTVIKSPRNRHCRHIGVVTRCKPHRSCHNRGVHICSSSRRLKCNRCLKCGFTLPMFLCFVFTQFRFQEVRERSVAFFEQTKDEALPKRLLRLRRRKLRKKVYRNGIYTMLGSSASCDNATCPSATPIYVFRYLHCFCQTGVPALAQSSCACALVPHPPSVCRSGVYKEVQYEVEQQSSFKGVIVHLLRGIYDGHISLS